MLKIKVTEEEVDLAYLADDVLADLCIAVVALIKNLSDGDPELADFLLTLVILMLKGSASAILDDTLRRVES